MERCLKTDDPPHPPAAPQGATSVIMRCLGFQHEAKCACVHMCHSWHSTLSKSPCYSACSPGSIWHRESYTVAPQQQI